MRLAVCLLILLECRFAAASSWVPAPSGPAQPGTPAQAAELFDKAWALAQQGNPLDAIPIFEAALRILPGSVPGRYYYALSLEAFPTEFYAARAAFKDVADQAPNSREGKDARSHITTLDHFISFDCVGQIPVGIESITKCRRFLADLPAGSRLAPYVRLLLANALIYADPRSPSAPAWENEARDILQTLLVQRPRWAYPIYLLSSIEMWKDGCKAVDLLNSAISINPNFAVAYNQRPLTRSRCRSSTSNTIAERDSDNAKYDQISGDHSIDSNLDFYR